MSTMTDPARIVVICTPFGVLSGPILDPSGTVFYLDELQFGESEIRKLNTEGSLEVIDGSPITITYSHTLLGKDEYRIYRLKNQWSPELQQFIINYFTYYSWRFREKIRVAGG